MDVTIARNQEVAGGIQMDEMSLGQRDTGINLEQVGLSIKQEKDAFEMADSEQIFTIDRNTLKTTKKLSSATSPKDKIKQRKTIENKTPTTQSDLVLTLSYKCDNCEYVTCKKKNYVRHTRIHTGEKPFQCEFCMKKFTRKSHFNAHMKMHPNEFPFNCSICQHVFSVEGEWQSHETKCKANKI